jgi:hypothetical protein
MSNYGESEQGAVTAEISLALKVLDAQIHLESPSREMRREHPIITNDRFTASLERMPNTDERNAATAWKRID